MLAGVFEDIGELKLKTVEEPQIKSPYDIKDQVELASICCTDIHILSDSPKHPGNTGFVLGHEIVGKVTEKGEEVTNV